MATPVRRHIEAHDGGYLCSARITRRDTPVDGDCQTCRVAMAPIEREPWHLQTDSRTRSLVPAVPQAQSTPSLVPEGRTGRVDRVEEQRHEPDDGEVARLGTRRSGP
jgi:hypothetical protein